MSDAPTIGRIVHFTLGEQEAAEINRRRTHGTSIAQRLAIEQWHPGAQAHIGNEAREGQVVPMIIVAVWGGDCVNGQAFLDGNDTYWVTSRHRTDEPTPGSWHWPLRNG